MTEKKDLKYRREVVPIDQIEARTIALLNVPGDRLMEGLLEAPTFVALRQTAPNWYFAQFGLIEFGAKDPLTAMSIAFLRDKGLEVIE